MGPKIPDSGIFGFWKYYYQISNQCRGICLSAKFRARMKMPNFGTKNTLFWYFWLEI